MLTIIIGAIICAILFHVGDSLSRSKVGRYITLTVVTIIFIFSLIIGLFVPVSGYKEWKIKNEIELLELSDYQTSKEEENVYVFVSKDNVYTYKYKSKPIFGIGTPEECETTISGIVGILEAPDCEVATLRTYTRKGKVSIWTFSIWTTETMQVFYIPEGTVVKQGKFD